MEIQENNKIEIEQALGEIGVITRKLASIQVIRKLKPIPTCDNIELAEILGWECIVKKTEFKEGDFCCFFEIDSILPEKDCFEFMRDKKFRVKSLKLRKVISQGLALPLGILNSYGELKASNLHGQVLRVGNETGTIDYVIEEGLDLTEFLGIRKYDPQAKAEKDALLALQNQLKKTKVPKWLMNIGLFRNVYFWLNPIIKGNWPNWIVKTDETRIQVCAKLLMDHYNEAWYVTEKLDGQSATYFTYVKKFWGFIRKLFGVASREVWRKNEDNSNYWTIARKYDIKKKFLSYDPNIIIQGEIIGQGIQGNKYKLNDLDFYVFNIILDGEKITLGSMRILTDNFGLKIVPIVSGNFIPSKELGQLETSDVVRALVQRSIGNSILYNCKREGLVYRLVNNPNISFKVINPEFSVREDKEEST